MVEFPPHPETLPALRYAQLTRARCLEELDARGISYGKAPPVPTIDAPLRLIGPLRGVAFEFWHPTAKKTKEGPILDWNAADLAARLPRVVRLGTVSPETEARWADHLLTGIGSV